MDHMKVLKRAWDVVKSYRMLWVMGFILALVTAEGGNGLQSSFSQGGGGGFSPSRGGDFPPSGGGVGPMPDIPPEAWSMVGGVVGIIVMLFCVFLLLAIIMTVVRYVMEAALIRMVVNHEETGEKCGFRQGVRMGWSRTALRFFLIDLVYEIPSTIVFILLFLLAGSPLLLWTVESTAARVIGTALAVLLLLLVVMLAIVVSAAWTFLQSFFWRASALEELGVVESFRRGYAIARRHLLDAGIMWLITIGLDLVWSLLMIPVALLLVILAGIMGAIPALIAGGLASLAFQDAVPWITAIVVGLPIFILVMVIPLTFLEGLMKTFQSTTWTLTYRELLALEAPAAE